MINKFNLKQIRLGEQGIQSLACNKSCKKHNHNKSQHHQDKQREKLTIGPFFKTYSLANLQACFTANTSIPSTYKNKVSNYIDCKYQNMYKKSNIDRKLEITNTN